MSKQLEITKLLGLLESLMVGEIRQLMEQIAKRVRRVDVPRAELERLVKQNKSIKEETRKLAQYIRNKHKKYQPHIIY